MAFTNRDLERIGPKMHVPHSDLTPYIQCYQSAYRDTDLADLVKHKIISDGGAGVVFNYGTPLSITIGEKTLKDISGCFITRRTINATYLTMKEEVHVIVTFPLS